MKTLIAVSLVVLVFNIPFGYWRAQVRKFSRQWFLSVHLPIPVIVALRIFSGIGFAWYTYLFLVFSFYLGQKIGEILLKRFEENNRRTSTCLITDLFKDL